MKLVSTYTANKTTDQASTQTQWCRCTRLRFVSILCTVLLTWLLCIMYGYHHPTTSTTCCPGQNTIPKAANENDPKIRRRYPQCIIIGVRKGGTRALLEFLSLHPNIVTTGYEPHFFDRDDRYRNGMDFYLKYMPNSSPQQITIEKTPSYFHEPEVPARVYRMNKTIKLILVVREPVERAISDYTQIHHNKLSHGKRHVSFRDLAIDNVTGRVRRTYIALRRSVYYRHMMKWLQYFPLDNFLIIKAQKLIDRPLEVVNRVETFLGLGHTVTEEDFYFNATRGFYCMRRKGSQQCLNESKGRPHVYVDRITRTVLRDYFRPFNRKFYDLVGEDFGW